MAKAKRIGLQKRRRIGAIFAGIAVASLAGIVILQTTSSAGACGQNPFIVALIVLLLVIAVAGPVVAFAVLFKLAWNSPRRVRNVIFVSAILLAALLYLHFTSHSSSPREQQTIQCLKTSTEANISNCP
ncbi:MAG TPA: hypothetical protein VMS08_03120 [Candidatus Saccharimonadia bacterium]|nr:hypothetical protein [Candidatus Saccharimonadia bacterium]